MKALGEVVVATKKSGEQDELVNFLCALNNDLKWNHENGICVTKIDMNSRINGQSFVDIVKIANREDIRDDLEELALTAINAFVYLNFSGENFIPLTKEAIIANEEFFEPLIPSIVPGDRYYLDIVEGKVVTYYETYIKTLQNESGYGNGNYITKSYSTPAGRAFSDKNLDAAFINIMFYPVIIASISILLAVVYVTVSLLI